MLLHFPLSLPAFKALIISSLNILRALTTLYLLHICLLGCSRSLNIKVLVEVLRLFAAVTVTSELKSVQMK